MFVDELIITVCSGRGGRGCESYFRRADHKRVPNGGDGGKGGDVILKVDPHMADLLSLRSKPDFEAESGAPGIGNNQHGANGEDREISVPCGTTVYNQRDNLLIRDLVLPSDEVMVLKGGRGGYGNHAGRPATSGQPGEELELKLSFKIIADIFILGLPNAGKTMLLRTLTRARVQETHYPFATKVPQLGTYQTEQGSYRLCELPSVYGASEAGRGLGTHYLKHLERAKLIFLTLDVKSEFAQDLKIGYDILLKAMEHFDPDFLRIPRFVVVNKVDLLGRKTGIKKFFPRKEKIYPISVLEEMGLNQLMADATKLVSAKCSKQ